MNRLAILAPFALALTGCGLQPMYAGGSSGVVATQLAAIDVPAIEGQAGWLVRNALVDRLGAGALAQHSQRQARALRRAREDEERVARLQAALQRRGQLHAARDAARCRCRVGCRDR